MNVSWSITLTPTPTPESTAGPRNRRGSTSGCDSLLSDARGWRRPADAGHLDQGESGCLSAADERESSEDRGVVVAVSIRVPARLGKQTSALVEADGLRRHACGLGGFSDAHDPTLGLDLAPRIKV